jgi:transcriptional regulator with XRE-family HTH domain
MIANKLREIRTARGLSQLQLSFLSQVPNCVISDIERGIRQPWPKVRHALARTLKIPILELFPNSDKPTQEIINPDNSEKLSPKLRVEIPSDYLGDGKGQHNLK